MPNHGGGFHDERRIALEKVLHSNVFSKSDSSRLILKFIVEKFLSGNLSSIKEYTIATEVLGRPPDFEPKADSIVRIQIQRLRKKLEEYYGDEGSADTFQILIPHGHYLPEFRIRPGTNQGVEKPALPPAPERSHVDSNRMSSPRLLLGLVGVLLAAVVIMGYLLYRNPKSNLNASAAATVLPDSLVPLWGVFLPPNNPPLIIYSNAPFLKDVYGDLYRVGHASSHSLPAGANVPELSWLEHVPPTLPGAGNLYYFDLYTGTGEVIAAAKIAQLLTAGKQEISAERSGLVSFDNIRGRNVIFLGAIGEDAILAKLPVEGELVFEMADTGYAVIRDRHPPPGQPDAYRLARDQKTGEFQTSYSLVSLLPGVEPDRYILVLGGITTLGTQAAAEFATSPGQMATLEKMRGASKAETAGSPYFQALLEVQIRSGSIARIRPLLVRELKRP